MKWARPWARHMKVMIISRKKAKLINPRKDEKSNEFGKRWDFETEAKNTLE